MATPYMLCSMLVLLALADGFMVAPIKLLTSSSGSWRSCCRQRSHGRVLTTRMVQNDDDSYISWLTHKVERARRPPFVKIARARLQRDFAVLLMRSSYQVRSQLGICYHMYMCIVGATYSHFFVFRFSHGWHETVSYALFMLYNFDTHFVPGIIPRVPGMVVHAYTHTCWFSVCQSQ